MNSSKGCLDILCLLKISKTSAKDHLLSKEQNNYLALESTNYDIFTTF